MLEKVDLNLSLTKKDYRDQMDKQNPRLTLLQRACWEAGIPSIIVFEGWDASGKGTSINLLAQNMDPRGFRIHPIKGATAQEKQMPWLWRFWQRIPNYGEVGIFDRSWYGRVLVERVEKLTPPALWQKAYHEILEFEQTLAEDGYVIMKFFLHISKKEQKRRFQRLKDDPLQSWRIQPEDQDHHRKYQEYLIATEEMLAMTESEWGPWTIVEATDRRWSWVKIVTTVNRRLEEALVKKGKAIPLPPPDEAAEDDLREPEDPQDEIKQEARL